MAILYGDRREDGLIRVWRTQHILPDGAGGTREITKEDAGKFPDGYWFDALPDAPAAVPGIDHTMYFNPDTEEFVWEATERPLTQEEIISSKLPALEARLAAIEGSVDVMEGKVGAIEKEIGVVGKDRE